MSAQDPARSVVQQRPIGLKRESRDCTGRQRCPDRFCRRRQPSDPASSGSPPCTTTQISSSSCRSRAQRSGPLRKFPNVFVHHHRSGTPRLVRHRVHIAVIAGEVTPLMYLQYEFPHRHRFPAGLSQRGNIKQLHMARELWRHGSISESSRLEAIPSDNPRDFLCRSRHSRQSARRSALSRTVSPSGYLPRSDIAAAARVAATSTAAFPKVIRRSCPSFKK